VIAPGGVDEEDVRRGLEATGRRLEHGALAEREQARLVGSAGRSCHEALSNYLPIAQHDGCRPRSVASPPGAMLAAREADEATAERERPSWRPPVLRDRAPERLLLDDQSV
jgi:hypothetical protein